MRIKLGGVDPTKQLDSYPFHRKYDLISKTQQKSESYIIDKGYLIYHENKKQKTA